MGSAATIDGMGGWFKRRWKSIEGRVLWGILALGGSYMLTFLPLAAFKTLASQSVTNRGIWLWSLVSPCLMGIFLFIYRDRTPKINIEVTMDDGHSAFAGLTVINLGAEHLFRAEAQIIGSNRPPNYPKGMFRLGWGDGTQPHVNIPRDASDRVHLGSFEDITKAHSLLEMQVWSLVSGESRKQWYARWLVEDKEALPYFHVRVVVIAEGTQKPWEKTFLLTPETRLGPLSLSPIEESV
jgi:hypothetical protein